MTESKKSLRCLIVECWKDEALKKRFESDPKIVLANYGIFVPDEMDVKVVENTDNTIHITLPAPPESLLHLKDEELASAAGGDENTLVFGCTITVKPCPYNPMP